MKTKNMLGNQSGFTLIEIVAVLIIIGILAAVAVPKYFDLTEEANQKAVEAQAANIRAASTLNFAKYKLNPNPGSGTQWISVDECSDATSLVEDWDGTFNIGGSGSHSATFTLMLTSGSSTTMGCTITD